MDRIEQSKKEHEVLLLNREKISIKGVIHVESFDDRQIVMDTDLGMLTITGEELEIKQLDLEEGNFAVEGIINSLQYSIGNRNNMKGKGLLERLFK